MADNLDGFGNGVGRGVDHGDSESEYFVDGYETLNNVAGWEIPESALRTEALRQVVIRLVARGLDDPDDLATLTLPGLVATIGQLEAKIGEQDLRIAQLEQALISVWRQVTGEN
jgi:hypothetical protein